jgi:hypothetical protein
MTLYKILSKQIDEQNKQIEQQQEGMSTPSVSLPSNVNMSTPFGSTSMSF